MLAPLVARIHLLIQRWALVLLITSFLPFVLTVLSGGAADSEQNIAVASIDGPISSAMARYVERAIGDAVADGAEAIIFQLDTPGGLASAMDDIDRDILESEIPVVVYVAPRGARAASAGVFITYASHIAAMAPGTNIGSASPVAADGSDIDPTMQAKIENDAVSSIRNLATLRGRNADWAESAVRDAANITAEDALQLNVIDLIATDLNDLVMQMDGRTVELATGPITLETSGATTSELNMNFFERLLQVVTDPTIAYLLLSIGMLGVFFELSNPGAIVPAVIGALGIVLGLFGLGTLPVDWTGAVLILLAFILFVADLYLPSLGLLTVAGLISFVVGSYMLLDSNGPPGTEISRMAIWLMAGVLVAIFAAIGYLVLRTRNTPASTGYEGLVGSVGVVRETLNPDGMVFVFGELWSASLEPEMKETEMFGGEAVLVSRIDGLRLIVRPASAQERAEAASAVVVPA